MTALILKPAVPRAPPVAAVPRDYVSFSAIRTYQQCPLRYYFKYIAGLPEETVSSSLVFGGAVHRAIEHHFRELLIGNSRPGLDALLAVYQQEWADRDSGRVQFGKTDTKDSLDVLAQRMLLAFLASELAVPQGRILAVEEELRGNVIPGVPDILARIDLIIETRQELLISDWKTSRSRWSAEQVEEASPQLLLYSDLARELAPGKALRIEFAVLTKTKEVTAERFGLAVDASQVARTKRMIERVWRAIEARHFYPAPSAMNCAACPFRQPCRHWPG